MKKFLFLFFPLASYAENYCADISGNRTEAAYRIVYDESDRSDSFQFCKIKSKNLYFLILERHPWPSLLIKTTINGNETIPTETLINKIEGGTYTEWVVSLTQAEFVYAANQFKIFDKIKSKGKPAPPDGSVWCFQTQITKSKCFSLDDSTNAKKFDVLVNLANFVESKFPTALKSN